MDKKIELYINGQLITGLGIDTEIQIEYSVKEFQSPEKNSATFSYEFEIPGNKNNNGIFQYIFEITEGMQFNPNAKNSAEIRINGLNILNGCVQLKNIITNFINNNKTITYNVTVFGSTKSLFIDIKDKYLKDLDFSKFDHEHTHDMVEASWANHYGDGYVYPIIDYGWDLQLNGYGGNPGIATIVDIASKNTLFGGSPANFTLSFLRLNDLYPATFVRDIFDVIGEQYGYTFDFNGMTYLDKLIIPYSNDEQYPVND